MGAANGEVIREPFDTKPSDQWVGCLLISLRSKGIERRSCAMGTGRCSESGAASPTMSPLSDCHPYTVSWCTLRPRGHIPDTSLGTTRGDWPSLPPAERCLYKTSARRTWILTKLSSGCKPCPSRAAGCPASVWPSLQLCFPEETMGRGKGPQQVSAAERWLVDARGRGGWSLLGGYLGSPGCPSCGRVCSAQPGWSKSPPGCSPPGVTSPKPFAVWHHLAGCGWQRLQGKPGQFCSGCIPSL